MHKLRVQQLSCISTSTFIFWELLLHHYLISIDKIILKFEINIWEGSFFIFNSKWVSQQQSKEKCIRKASLSALLFFPTWLSINRVLLLMNFFLFSLSCRSESDLKDWCTLQLQIRDQQNMCNSYINTKKLLEVSESRFIHKYCKQWKTTYFLIINLFLLNQQLSNSI